MALVASNFRFKLDENFDLIFRLVFEKTKHLEVVEVQKKFEQLLLMSAEEWNEKFRGFGGYPNLSQWIEILSGKRPLTDAEKIEANRRHEEGLRIAVGTIIVWINDQNLDILFKNKYKNQENKGLVVLINSYAGKPATNDEEIIKLGRWLKSKYQADKALFKAKLKGIADQQNPLPFLIEDKPKQSNIIQLPTLKKI